jgi:multiple sugar transport system substrate-binding protein
MIAQVCFQDMAIPWSGERCDTLLPRPTLVTRRELLLSSGSAAGLLSAACGRAGGRAEQPEQPAKITQPVTLLYWTILGGADGSRMKELSQQYAKEHPLVTIEDIQGVPDFLTKFASSVVTGTAPDVVCIRQIYVPGFAEGNMLFDLLPRELQQVGLKAEDFAPNVWRASEYKGKRYSIPLDIHGYMLFYNASVVAESGLDPNKPPQTWNDWLDWIRQLTRSDRHGGFVSDGGEGLIWTFYHHLRQAGGTLFSDDGKKAAFNSAAGHTALSFMAEVFLRANQPLPQPLLDMFEQRRVASFLNGPWNLNRLGRPDNPVFNDLRVGFAPSSILPDLHGGPRATSSPCLGKTK